MTILTQHPDYTVASERWHLIRSIVNNTAKEYIRTPDINDKARSAQYKNDAILTNFTNLTRVGLTGLVFRKEPIINLPSGMEYLYNNFTGSGINIWQFSQHAIGELLQMGRYGFLVDKADGGKTYIRPYIAENITNWKTCEINGEGVLSLVVLREYTLSDENIFSQDMIKQYRVLFLDENNVYRQEVYRYQNEYMVNDGYNIAEEYIPVDSNGNPFNYIPFVFCGSENNDWQIDPQPLYDMAVVNLGHYRNSADYEESIFITGQPYLVVNVGESSEEEFTSANPNGVSFGSRKALVVSSGGSAQLLQANANQLVAQAMKEKLEQAAAIGARLIAPPGGRETAEAAKIRYGSQHSALYTLTSNYNWAVEDAVRIACSFEGTNTADVRFKLSDQFYDEMADPNLIAQQIMLLDRGVIGQQDIRDYGRRTGFISDDRTDEQIKADIEQNDPLIGAINDNAGQNTSPSNIANEANQNPGENN